MPVPPLRIAVFGAGIAGLAAADALARRGYRISVYESLGEPGGFFRSARKVEQGNLPTEYSWHGMGPWYYNVFDLLRQIPFDATGSIYERALSRPIDFGIFPQRGRAEFFDQRLRNLPRMFRLGWWEFLRAAWLMVKIWTADERSLDQYSHLNAAAAWKDCMRPAGWTAWRACFGPWIGSDWINVSLHTAGRFFQKQLCSKAAHFHPADHDGGPWVHGQRDGWLLFKGPSSEVWFQKWIQFLTSLGVEFHWNQRLERLHFDGEKITAAEVSGTSISADHYIVAANPFATAAVLDRSSGLTAKDQLNLFPGLIQDGPHVQVSFRIAFSSPIQFPRDRTAVVIADSEFNLTLFAQEQVWLHADDIGAGVRSLWTGTSCVSSVPGRLFGLPVSRCTKEQFIAEIKAQIFACESLQALIRDANQGRDLHDFPIALIEVWHEWEFSADGIRGSQPKWVNTFHNQPYLPTQTTPIPNLFLAGAHTRTQADVWSIEAAVESGRRAARAIDSSVPVIAQDQLPFFRLLARIDNACYRTGAPHVLDLLAFAFLAAVVFMIVFIL